MFFTRLHDWLTLKDLDMALEDARMSVIKRYSRGNVSVQNGGILDEDGLATLQRNGNSAVSILEKSQRKFDRDGDPRRVRREDHPDNC